MIRIENLDIGYDSGEPLIRGADLMVQAGEMVALAGRNGSGKSTLIKSFLGLIPLLSGTCTIRGLPVESYGLQQRARLISYVSSNLSQIPSVSVLELVSLGRLPYTGWSGRLSKNDRSAIELSLDRVGLTAFVNRKLDLLSDGERQRAMIARALAQDTDLIVLDEPTAFLDLPNKFELTRILSELRDQGKSIIYSTHDLETAWLWADKFWVIHQREVHEGAPEDLGLNGLFNDLFGESDIYFDQSGRRFKTRRSHRGSVQLKGNEELATSWTRNALERIGFETDDQNISAIRIEVNMVAHRNEWNVRHGKKEFKFENIYSMIRFLLQAK